MCVDTDTGTRYAIKIFKKSLLKRRQSRFQGTAFDDVSLHGPADTALPPWPASLRATRASPPPPTPRPHLSTSPPPRLPTSPPTHRAQVLREIAIMRKLDHENVVNMHDVIDDVFANKLYMVIDYCKARRRRAAAAWGPAAPERAPQAARCAAPHALPTRMSRAPRMRARPLSPRSTAPSWTRTRCRAVHSS